MTRHLLLLLASAMLAACSGGNTSQLTIPANTSTTTPAAPDHVVLPPLAGGAMPKLQSGQISLTGETGAGTASFTAAPRWDDGRSDPTVPPRFGGGAFSISLGASSHVSTAAQSVFDVLSDDTSTSQYLVLGLLDQSDADNRAQMVYAVVKASDFVAGADIALDGVDRYALYVAGPLDQDQPDTLAVASVGTLHLGAGAALDGTIDATLTATFATADVSALDPGDPTQGTDGGATPPPAPPLAGSYTLHFGAVVDARCEGGLAGKEADFTSLAPSSYGFVDQGVQIAVTSGQVNITGAGLSAAFGQNPLSLIVTPDAPGFGNDWELPTGLLAPDNTIRRVASLLIGPVSAAAPYPGYAGLYFEVPATPDSCTITREVSFSP